MFCCFSLLLTSFLYASRGTATPCGAIFMLDKASDLVYNGCNSDNKFGIKREGDRAVYRLFALYGGFDKVV